MVIGWIAIFVAGAAIGQSDADQAKQLFREGYDLAVEEKWAEALEKLEASRELVERPSTVFNIGTVLLRLGRPLDAIAAFERYLELAPENDPSRDEATSLLEESRRSVAVLEVRLEPNSAELEIDGRRIDPTRPIMLDPGKRQIAATASGFIDGQVTVELAPGEAKQIALVLLAEAPPPPPPPPPQPIEPPRMVVAPPIEQEPSFVETPTFWVLLGVGVVVVGGAVAIALAVKPGEEEPYRGTFDTVLEGLRAP